jgi:hypothetical protein
MKIYKLWESSTGYIWNFTVYTGKDTTHPGEHTSLTTVLEIAHHLLGRGYCLYLDNWYTCPKLVDTLCSRKTDVVGTMRTKGKDLSDFVKRANSGSILQETNDHEVLRNETSSSSARFMMMTWWI